MHYQLSADQQAPVTIPFLRMFAPTDIQKVSQAMFKIIGDYYPGVDLFNPDLWRIRGMTSTEGPLITFLTRLIKWQKDMKQNMVDTDREYFIDYMTKTYGGKNPAQFAKDLADHMNSYVTAYQSGLVPASIAQPWTYTPTSVAEDIGVVTKDVAKNAVGPLLPLILGGIAVYAAVTVLLPKLILQRT